MPLLLNEEQEMLRDSARDFLRENAPVSQLRKLRDSRDPAGFSGPLWSRFADMGYTGMLVPEAFGGAGLGMVEAGVLMEQIGHHLSATPFLASGVLAVTALRQAGSAGTAAAMAAAPGQRRGHRHAGGGRTAANTGRKPSRCARRAMATAGGSTAPRPSCSTATWRRC